MNRNGILLAALTILLSACWPYRRIDTLEAERTRAIQQADAERSRAAELAASAGDVYSRAPKDSESVAIGLWREAASLFSAAAEPRLAAAMFSSIAVAYGSAGDTALASTYRALATSFRNSAVSDGVYNAAGAAAAVQLGRPVAAEAAEAAEYGETVVRRAANLHDVVAASDLQKIGGLYAELKQRDSSLAYFGRALIATGALAPDSVEALMLRSPLMDTTDSPADTANFVLRANAILQLIPHKPDALTQATTIVRASADLEDLLASTRVRAIVTSDPSGADVRYWPLIADSTVSRDVFTADTIFLRPAAYVFSVRPRERRPMQQRRVSCATGCRVYFDLRHR